MNTGQNKPGGVYEMTPEQKAKLKNFGKKNGLSEQKVQTQLSPKNTVQQVIAETPSPSVTQTDSQPEIQVKKAVEQPAEKLPKKECQTYYCYRDEEAGNLEIDLITFREKGTETRYLSILFSGNDVRQEPPTPQEAFLNIGSREEFDILKSFFAQLEWES